MINCTIYLQQSECIIITHYCTMIAMLAGSFLVLQYVLKMIRQTGSITGTVATPS